METKKYQNAQKNRFLKLSLKKNRPKDDVKRRNRSSDLIILDESFDRLKTDLTNRVQPTLRIYSPIVISDSSGQSSNNDQSKDSILNKTPSNVGHVSFNRLQNDTSISEVRESRPSTGGWSPAQSIICATPKHQTIPSTPKDEANESLEQCSIKQIQKSQKKLLNELYGEVWKSIPSLFKTSSKQDGHNIDAVTKILKYDNEDSDKENNIRIHIKQTKELYLTGSDAKRKVRIEESEAEKKSKKKLYTEKIPDTPDLTRQRSVRAKKDPNATGKKPQSVTEMVEIMKDKFDVDSLTQKVADVCVTPKNNNAVKRLSFVGSLADNIPSWRCHPEAFEYKDNYKCLREKLAKRLFKEFNSKVFDEGLDADMPVVWDSKLRSTAGTTTNRLIKNANGIKLRTSSVKLSIKVVDGPQRLRDTLIHEMCHAATWVIDHELRAAHGPLWKKWATRALKVYPELGEISRCHDMEIHFKYSYKCSKCGYTIQRHSKSIDVTKKCCGYCRGHFELIVNKKTKDGVVVSTPARKGEANEFALYVKQNYGTMKDGTKSHAQVMKTLGEQFSARKNRVGNSS